MGGYVFDVDVLFNKLYSVEPSPRVMVFSMRNLLALPPSR